jgi:hypothetical protein
MKKKFAVAVCAVCVIWLCAAGIAAQKSSSASKASFEKFVEESNKAQTANDANWMETNLAAGYVEGTSFGTWIPKVQLIKDANDPANNKFTKSDVATYKQKLSGLGTSMSDIGIWVRRDKPAWSRG